MIDIACLAVIGITVYFVANEGAWGAAHSFLCVLLAALVAMNYFEPLANLLDGLLPAYKSYMDIVALVGLFIGLTFALRLGSEHLAPTYIGLPSMLDQAGKWAFSALTGYLTMAFLLTALHTAPLPREFMGFKSERNNFFGMAPDRQWLGFVQYVSEKPLARALYRAKDTNEILVNAFDGRVLRLGDKTTPYPNSVWPSFPIRYAMRRERIDNNQSAAAAATPVQQVAPVNTGGGNVGF